MTERFDGNLLDEYSGSFTRLHEADIKVIETLQGLCHWENLRSAFQPIFRSSNGELEGWEALLRVAPETGFTVPTDVFAAATRVGLLLALESAATRRHLSDASSRLGPHRLFLNVAAPLFSDARFGVAWLAAEAKKASILPTQIILEIPETLRIKDVGAFQKHLEPFRREGFRIAIDDFGAGYTNLRMIADLQPDFVKVDRVFIDGISSHARKRILVESVVSLCHRVSCAVIAEGVETPEDLEACLAAGADFLQGFLFAEPGPAETAFAVKDLTIKSPPRLTTRDDVRRLLVAEAPLTRRTMEEAAALFATRPRLRAIPVVENDRIVALVPRSRAADAPEAFDTILETASAEDAAEAVDRRPESRRFDPIVVVGEGGVYRGLLEVDVLLADLARANARLALQAHPVTGLPGAPILERALGAILARGSPVALGRVNVRRLGPFNDRYGIARGDELLSQLASLLKETIGPLPGALIAHTANGDLAYLAPVENAEEAAIALLSRFPDAVKPLHDPEDVEAGAFVVRNRMGTDQRLPLAGLAIGLVLCRGEDVDARAVLQTAQSTLDGAKTDEVSRVLVNRRRMSTANRLSKK